MKTHDFDLRFGNRVLAFHAYVNTNRDARELGRHIQRATGGPRLDAQAMWIEGRSGEEGAALWAAMCAEQKIENNHTFQYDGHPIVAFHVFVNTDADAYHIHKTVLKLARGPRLDTCVVYAESYEGDDGVKAWAVIQDVVKKTAANPKVQEFER